MKRYSIDELTRAKDKNGDYCEYDEVNETIMNMVDEFAETAKEYEAELARRDELIKEQYSKIEELNESNEAAWAWKKEYEADLAQKVEEIETLKDICAEKEKELFRKDAEIARLRKVGESRVSRRGMAGYQPPEVSTTPIVPPVGGTGEVSPCRKCICVDFLNGNPDPVPNPDCLVHGTLRRKGGE